ncbi:hypothetical protein HZB94_01100, partial [Candidatus Falkowbacteria bacterium]|nr:hypothetical protein [Candidatus Falkowbacteria bacterium]
MKFLSIVLYILLGVFLGCEAGGGGGNGDNPDLCAGPKADRPAYCNNLETDSAINEPDANEPPPGFCGDGVCG